MLPQPAPVGRARATAQRGARHQRPPHAAAYYELWLNGEPVTPDGEPLPEPTAPDHEPIYGRTYLPRKFKIALALPPANDTDVLANDIGLIGIEEGGALVGFNVAVGGGLGMSFGMPATYPRLADVVGFVPVEEAVAVCERIVTIQRDWGNRSERKFSRLKYTLDRMGLPAFREELHRRLGHELAPTRPYRFTHSADTYGWATSPDGYAHLTLFVEGGRVADTAPGHGLKSALRAIAAYHTGEFALTGNQNLVIVNIAPQHRERVAADLAAHDQWDATANAAFTQTALRRHSLACVALNTCSQAFAEAERYLPDLLDRLDAVLRAHGLADAGILIRMTGCPNGCARPYLGEIGLVGRAPGRYNLYLGADNAGQRLNKLYREQLDEAAIVAELTPLLAAYAADRRPAEGFGDFVVRRGYVAATTHGLDFHA